MSASWFLPKMITSISADYDPSIPELYADESMMIQVILNITRNAVKAINSINNKKGKIKFKTRTQRNCKIGFTPIRWSQRLKSKTMAAAYRMNYRKKYLCR